jgi:lambda family phage portal protein
MSGGPTVKLLGPDGRALPPSRPRQRALMGGPGGPAYDAADVYGDHMAAWRPGLWSPDNEMNGYRDRIVARARDLVRNDGWASGAVTRLLDNAIGASFRPISKPDYRALAAHSGNPAFDDRWADEFGNALDAHYRTWANSSGFWCDTQRASTIPQMMYLAFRHLAVDGDALSMLHWLPERIGAGRSHYATTLQLIDPDRLSNPQMQFDQQTMRGGVRVDEFGAATGYYIRRAHQGDWFDAARSVTWDLVPRETDWGRPIIVHYFDQDRAGQHRGGAGFLTPVIQRLKMLIKYDGTELDAAILNAIFGAYIESPFDPQLVQDALGDSEHLNWYQTERSSWHQGRRIMLGGAQMPHLFPGEKIGQVSAERPTSNFGEFEGAMLRNFAAGTGLSAQQVSNNWSDVNYSSARGALLEAWKTLARRKTNFAVGFASPIRSAFVEEAMAVDDLPLPNNAPDFMECRTAYTRCRWMGPARGWIDPVAEKQGAVLGMDAALSTLEDEAGEQGLDWEEVLDQRKREIAAFRARGLEPPSWAQMNIPAEQSARPPKKPEAV